MIVIKGNLLDTPIKLIAHQVNCQGVMGGGVARQIKERYPEIYQNYQEKLKNYVKRTGRRPLGLSFNLTTEDNTHTIMNIFGQDFYGRDKQYTDYKALFKGFVDSITDYRDINKFNSDVQIPIAIPYNIGCGLAGGDWSIVEKILKEIEVKYNVIFIAYKLD